MATVLVYTSPGRGHLFPIMDTALSLKRRGHDIRMRTLADELQLVTAAGISAKPIAAQIEARPVDDWKTSNPMASVKLALKTFIDRASMEIDDIKRAIAGEKPDLLLIDTNCWGAQAVAETSGLPWATWHPFPLPLPSKDAPPFGPGLSPARGALGRLRDRLLQPLVIGPLQKSLPSLNRVRASVGATQFAHITDLYRAPPVMLYQTAPPFDYARSDLPANIKCVGPGLWSPPSTSTPAWLHNAKPIVLVTCSTEFQNDKALLDTAIAAFADDSSIQLVCTTAGIDPKSVTAPAHVVVERFVPHASVLPRACAVICHGGMGITQRALSMGVPPCVVPWGRDQLEVGRRVEVARAGAMLPRGKLSPSRLRAAVAVARECKDGVARVQAGYQAAGGAERSAALLEELVAKPVRAAA